MQFTNSIGFRNLADLPEISAIYMVESQRLGILYIGQSKQLRSRWQRHHRLNQIQDLDPSAKLSWFACQVELLNQLEKELIQQRNPLLNGSPVIESKKEWSEKILQRTLLKLAPYVAVFGIDRQESPPTIVMRYFGTLESGISPRIRTILKGKWIEFVKRKYGGWWKFKCNGFQFELGPWLYEDTPTRTAMNSNMSKVLIGKFFPNQKEFSSSDWKVIIKKKRTIEENIEILRTTKLGVDLFPIQSQSKFSELASVPLLTLSQAQINQINLDLETLLKQDPVPLFGK